MTQDDLQRIEQALGQPLSPAVRHFFLNYPPELRSWVDLDDARGAVYRVEAGTIPEHSNSAADSLEEFAQGLIESYRN